MGKKILWGVPQTSILGPLLFNIFIGDIFFTVKNTDFTCNADDNTRFIVRDNAKDAIKDLHEIGKILIKWFSDN